MSSTNRPSTDATSAEADLDQFDNLETCSRRPPALTSSTEFECDELLATVTPEEATKDTFEMDDDSWQCGLA